MNIKLIVYDFDGVLTDNRVWVDAEGHEWVSCNRSDGLWIGKLKAENTYQMVLSTETNPVVTARCEKLQIQCYQGINDKLTVLKNIAFDHNIELSEILYVGNDVNDKAVMLEVGHSACPEDSHPEILEISGNVLPVKGGAGIVSHVYRLIHS